MAARLAEDAVSVCLLEAGPPDERDDRVLVLRNYESLLGSDLDYDYAIEPQEQGNSLIRHSRGRVLGGCASHNGGACFQTPSIDLEAWEAAGASGWGAEACQPFFDRVFERVHMEKPPPVNACGVAFVEAAQQAGYPLCDFGRTEPREGVGWFLLHKSGELRQSTSVAYLHPLDRVPANLTVRTDTTALRVLIDETRNAVGVETIRGTIRARREVILCCGSIDTPKLLMLSGIGPAAHLKEVGVSPLVDLPGVGEHLIDHPESVVNWESSRPVPEKSTQWWECALFACSEPTLESHDLLCVFATVPYDLFTVQRGYPTVPRGEGFAFAPHVSRARSEGIVRLGSADPNDPPSIDPRFFTDAEGYDAKTLVAGVKLGRRLAETSTLGAWIRRELSPGPEVQDDDDLSEYVRLTSNTSYHPAGTCRIGRPGDRLTVVDPELRVRGVGRLRVADASNFPTYVAVNPVVTVMMIGEKAAYHIRSTH